MNSIISTVPSLAAWRPRHVLWILVALALALAIAVAFWDALGWMWTIWTTKDEYSHGPLIPAISGYLLWQRRACLAAISWRGSWWGAALLGCAALLHMLGELTTIYTLSQIAFVLTIYGLLLAAVGWRGVREMALPLGLLIFMIPLPDFLLNRFSGELQLFSSQAGVALMRLAGVSVFLEGNVIDLGVYQLQVAEACSGLRYLFPLMTLGFIMACMFRAAMWQRLVLFASTVPLAILMNALRVGTIGIAVEHWGPALAEGFVHELHGWIMFMICSAILVLELPLLARLGRDRTHWRDLLSGGSAPPRAAAGAAPIDRSVGTPFVAGAGLLILILACGLLLPQRVEAHPTRLEFAEFPTRLGDWRGHRTALEQMYLDALKLDDYLMSDFVGPASSLPVNLYAAWYKSQRQGESAHSPKSCIPGGGWSIVSITPMSIAGAGSGGRALTVNRVLIQLGQQRQIVYYWFQQRGRVITNEYLLKWYILVDAFTRNRTDGALVRLSTPVVMDRDSEADARLQEFARVLAPVLTRYVPD
ncbi:MAG TPA: VPLPA-CTERM-specific exosortase XrtD [Steroidobacteraceae bacterium]|nr:VPLPA-CTERM-specific exosortase XrtD [Steroidobacteraceae bacterium]